MKPVEFEERNCVFAEDQPEYLPLPAFRDPDGVVVSCWELSEEEVELIRQSKKIWVIMYTFNNPLQPLCLTADKPLE